MYMERTLNGARHRPPDGLGMDVSFRSWHKSREFTKGGLGKAGLAIII